MADPSAARDGKRRLPMLQSSPAEEDEPPRPRWQWIVFGALGIITTWVPAAALAGAFVARATVPGSGGIGLELAVVGAYTLALGAGAAAGGYVVGRWGATGVGTGEAALAGLAASAAATAASWATLGLAPGAIVVPLLTVPIAALGGRLGLRRRARPG